MFITVNKKIAVAFSCSSEIEWQTIGLLNSQQAFSRLFCRRSFRPNVQSFVSASVGLCELKYIKSNSSLCCHIAVDSLSLLSTCVPILLCVRQEVYQNLRTSRGQEVRCTPPPFCLLNGVSLEESTAAYL